MTVVQMKSQLTTLLDVLPESKLAAVFDFAQFLAEREIQAGWLNAQSQSAIYREWVSRDNDVYDEVFADADPAR